MSKLGEQGDTQRHFKKTVYTNLQGNNHKISIKIYSGVCLNARSITNKRSDLDFMIAYIEPDITGITESWANKDMVDAELMLGEMTSSCYFSYRTVSLHNMF